MKSIIEIIQTSNEHIQFKAESIFSKEMTLFVVNIQPEEN